MCLLGSINNVNEDTQEMPQSRSTVLPMHKKKERSYEEQIMTKQTPLIKRLMRAQKKKKSQQRYSLGKVSRRTTDVGRGKEVWGGCLNKVYWCEFYSSKHADMDYRVISARLLLGFYRRFFIIQNL